MTRSRSLNAVARHYAVTALHNAGVDNWSRFLSLSDTMIGNMKKTEGNQQVPLSPSEVTFMTMLKHFYHHCCSQVNARLDPKGLDYTLFAEYGMDIYNPDKPTGPWSQSAIEDRQTQDLLKAMSKPDAREYKTISDITGFTRWSEETVDTLKIHQLHKSLCGTETQQKGAI